MSVVGETRSRDLFRGCGGGKESIDGLGGLLRNCMLLGSRDLVEWIRR